MYPEAIALLPYANFFAISFFLMLYSLGLDSCVSLLDLLDNRSQMISFINLVVCSNRDNYHLYNR